jgi:cytochrome P450
MKGQYTILFWKELIYIYNSVQVMETLFKFINPYITDHMSTFQEDESPRDLMDLIIQENRDTTDPGSPFFAHKGRAALFNIFLELFLAGMGTTSASLVWTFLYMIHHPEIQRKVHMELDQVTN